MLCRVFVTGWFELRELQVYLPIDFTMTGRSYPDEPVFDCGVFYYDEIAALSRCMSGVHWLHILRTLDLVPVHED